MFPTFYVHGFSFFFNLTVQLEHPEVQELQQCNDNKRVVTKKEESCLLDQSFYPKVPTHGEFQLPVTCVTRSIIWW